MAKSSNKKPSPTGGRKPVPVSGPAKTADRAAAAGKQPLTIGKGTALTIALAVTAIVVALGVFHLIVRNSDVLFAAQEKSFFTTNRAFIEECMRQPGGLICWLSSYLTQYFYHPALGASIMIGLWCIALWLSKWAFRVPLVWMAVLAMPIVCLLVSMIDTGYWLYYVKQPGHWFFGTVGYLATMLLVLLYSYFKKRMDKVIATILIALTYPFLGWYSLLALLYTAAISAADKSGSETWVGKIAQPLTAVLLVAVVPLGCYYLYSEIRIEDVWTAGFPYFTNDNIISLIPEIPFIVMAILPLGFAFIPKEREPKGAAAWSPCIVSVAVVAFAIFWTEKADFQNYNYHAEMRMYRAADEQDWDKVLDEMGNIPGDASRQMVLLKNIALLNKGEMGAKMYHYNNMGEPPTNGFDTLHVHMVQTAAPLIYYYHGKTNFTVRWCIENSVEFGYDFDNLKMLARCALISGEMDVAKKYLSILKTSRFHKDWAEHLWPITEKPKLIKEYHEFDNVCELRDHMGSVLDGDNGLCEMYLLNYFSNTMNVDSKLLQELTLNYAMVQKDIQLFWPRFFLYAQLHPNEKMPIHYQEAAFLYGNLEPQNVDIKHMPFDKEIVERYQSFQQLSQSLLATGMKSPEVGEAMKGSFGDTFYWFYFFCRDVHSY